MGLFGGGIDIEGGIINAEGWFRTGTRPNLGRPLAEIYSVSDRDDPSDLWFLREQERLSYLPRWKDDYFQYWAEALAFHHAGDTIVGDLWVIVVFDAAGNLASRVDYWPVFADGRVDDVSYANTTDKLGGGSPASPWRDRWRTSRTN